MLSGGVGSAVGYPVEVLTQNLSPAANAFFTSTADGISAYGINLGTQSLEMLIDGNFDPDNLDYQAAMNDAFISAASTAAGTLANRAKAKPPQENTPLGQEQGRVVVDDGDAPVQRPKDSESFSNWDDMKAAHKGTVTRFLQDNKPTGSPVPKKWFENGGSLAIDTMEDGSQVWRYTSASGDTVPYVVPPGHPRFPDAYLHPDKNIANIDIGEFTGDRSADKRLVLDALKKNGYDEVPEGYIVHHDTESGKIQLVREDIHGGFSHYGGHSANKK